MATIIQSQLESNIYDHDYIRAKRGPKALDRNLIVPIIKDFKDGVKIKVICKKYNISWYIAKRYINEYESEYYSLINAHSS